jgi:hypothetical protein
MSDIVDNIIDQIAGEGTAARFAEENRRFELEKYRREAAAAKRKREVQPEPQPPTRATQAQLNAQINDAIDFYDENTAVPAHNQVCADVIANFTDAFQEIDVLKAESAARKAESEARKAENELLRAEIATLRAMVSGEIKTIPGSVVDGWSKSRWHQ